MNPEYDEHFDLFLYQEIGYSILRNYTSSLFCSPYGITSLREYFANAFEHYFYSSDPYYVKSISPEIYTKIQELLSND